MRRTGFPLETGNVPYVVQFDTVLGNLSFNDVGDVTLPGYVFWAQTTHRGASIKRVPYNGEA